MRVLVTGAAGNLGRVVLPALEAAGHDPIALDQRPLDRASAIVADLGDRSAVQGAADGCDAIVHGAALHGVHLRRHAPAEFWDVNVTGTFNVYEAAREHGVDRVVLSSTMGVYGESLRRTSDAFAWTSEADPLLPGDIYGLSKAVCEQMGAYYARVHGIVTVALRFGMYVPERTLERYGFRLLFGGVDDRDVAQAVMCALAYEPSGGFDAFDIMAPVPFAREDAAAMAQAPEELIERRWPGTRALACERGVEIAPLIWGETLWPIDKATRELGWHPRHGFGEFLEAWRSGDASYYPFLGLPQWGV